MTLFCVDCGEPEFDENLNSDGRCLGCEDNHEDAERERRQMSWNPFDYD